MSSVAATRRATVVLPAPDVPATRTRLGRTGKDATASSRGIIGHYLGPLTSLTYFSALLATSVSTPTAACEDDFIWRVDLHAHAVPSG